MGCVYMKLRSLIIFKFEESGVDTHFFEGNIKVCLIENEKNT